MIKNQWYAVLESKELKNKPVGVTRFSTKLVLWRTEDHQVGCIYDRCCHRGASLSLGKICQGEVCCPFHGFAYRPDGKVAYIPANGRKSIVPDYYNVPSYHAQEAYGFIWVWYGDPQESYPEIPFFEELKEGFVYGSFSEVWNVHYTRAIENQLDVVHLPFVHGNTIGKGHKAVVNGPVCKWEENLMTFYVNNVQDEGQTPLTPEEIENYDSLFSLQLLMPHLWQNRISDKLRIMAAFVPIDEENTRIYLRFYERFLKVPVLKNIVLGLGNLSNKVILHQDRRVVLTQLPKKSELRMKEKLIQGDLPIMEYRAKREEMKQVTNQANK